MNEIVVDNFAGGGGASTGIEIAIGRSVDIAINHDPAAIAMHRANHPATEHYTEDVWKVDPVEACAGRPVALAWFSPDCKHHSKAKGGKPVSKKIRGLAWVAVKWAKAVHPRVIMLENVEEFQDWGRLDEKNRPDPRYKGETFRRFVGQLEKLGGDERIAGALRKARQKVDRKYIRGDAWDDSFAVERMAALERRYQESIEEMQRNHQAEITRLESVIAHQAEQVREMAVYKARAEAAEGAATDLCGDFVDFVCEGVGGNAAEYCANRSAECVDAYGECDMGSRFCKGFFPEAAREWTKRSIQEE